MNSHHAGYNWLHLAAGLQAGSNEFGWAFYRVGGATRGRTEKKRPVRGDVVDQRTPIGRQMSPDRPDWVRRFHWRWHGPRANDNASTHALNPPTFKRAGNCSLVGLNLLSQPAKRCPPVDSDKNVSNAVVPPRELYSRRFVLPPGQPGPTEYTPTPIGYI